MKTENKSLKEEIDKLKTLTDKRKHAANNAKHSNSKYRCDLCFVYGTYPEIAQKVIEGAQIELSQDFQAGKSEPSQEKNT